MRAEFIGAVPIRSGEGQLRCSLIAADFRDRLGLTSLYIDGGFAVVERDDAPSPAGGAELASGGVLHPVSRDGITETNFGTREFATVDADGNSIEFFHWTP